MSLVVVGTMAFDAIETPFGKTDKILGGAATYAGLAASYFVKPVNAISVVGYDFEQEIIDMLKSHGVSMEGVEIRQDEKSFFWAGKYHTDMNTRDTLATDLNVLATFNPQVPKSYQDSEFLFLGNLTPDIQIQVIEQMENRPKLIGLDTMNFWMDTAMDRLKVALGMVDVLLINDEEARQLSEEYSLRKAARKIMDMGPKYLVIKKGEHGALLFHKDELFSAPGLPLEEVFDPTGAGDTFAGGFMGYMASSGEVSFESMKRAIIFGSALASFCVEKFGPERLMNLSKNEIDARVSEFVSLANFDIPSREILDMMDQSA
ncbi:MAG: PfkB family carbohydrate kinase [Bacteroidota bacterium]